MSSEAPEPWTDWRTLLTAAQAGDSGAVNSLALALGSMSRRFFLSKGLSVSHAEEQAVTCVTETWLRLPKFRGENFPAWVHTIFLHLLIDEHRKRAKWVRDESDDQLARFSNGDRPTPLEATLRRAVGGALGRLGEKDQLIVRLRHCREPVEFKEIGKELGMESGAVRTRYLRARKQIEGVLRNDPRMKARIARCAVSTTAARHIHPHETIHE